MEFNYFLPVNIVFGSGKVLETGELTRPYGKKALQQQRRKAQILQMQMVVMLSLPSVVEVSWTVQKRLHF